MMKFLVATISIRDSTEERKADGDSTIPKSSLVGTKMFKKKKGPLLCRTGGSTH
jgi:hypothetical protein